MRYYEHNIHKMPTESYTSISCLLSTLKLLMNLSIVKNYDMATSYLCAH